MPPDPVVPPRSGGDDEAARLPQQRASAEDSDPAPGADGASEPVLGDPRPAPDDAPALAALGGLGPAPSLGPGPRVYADGSALAQYVVGSSSHDEWAEWAKDHEDELVTTPLGLTELRRLALPAGVEARGVARDVEARVTVVRFSDQSLRAATKVSGVLAPFTALHIGAVLAHPEVVAVATYETQLARVAALHGLLVVSPGMAPFWWESAD
ncbi:hypothetical protein [Cellulomonas sp. URHD0024]|uniref:hypothetical protein n=1 Tax=Cellulomonas sp. URHD0024 TaxID=1302620 RepID=UPI001E4FD341|nr:hypothetical protein [Cellulomonas sp. URHD0024]